MSPLRRNETSEGFLASWREIALIYATNTPDLAIVDCATSKKFS